MAREPAPWEKTPPSPTPAEAKAERAEKAAIRRRWITLGEVLAVLAVAISALTLWNSWSERSHQEAEHAADAAKAQKASATLVLKATPTKNQDRLDLAPTAEDQTVQSQRILFAGKSWDAAIDTTGAAHIDGSWLKQAVKTGDLPHDRDLRLPVAISTRFVSGGGEPIEQTALYHVGYRIDGGLFGSSVRLTGLSLIRRVPTGQAKKALDALR